MRNKRITTTYTHEELVKIATVMAVKDFPSFGATIRHLIKPALIKELKNAKLRTSEVECKTS